MTLNGAEPSELANNKATLAKLPGKKNMTENPTLLSRRKLPADYFKVEMDREGWKGERAEVRGDEPFSYFSCLI